MKKYKLACLVLVWLFVVETNAEVIEVSRLDQHISVKFEIVPFVKEGHKLEFEKANQNESEAPMLMTVDGLDYFGTDGSVPSREIVSFVVRVRGGCYCLPQKSFKNLFNPGLVTIALPERPGSWPPSGISLSEEGAVIKLAWGGGDGAGSYSVRWEINAKLRSVERFVWEFPESDEPLTDRFDISVCVPSVPSPASTDQSEPEKGE